MFKLAEGDLLGLPTNENHINVEWEERRVLFSMTRRGDALSCHFTSDKDGLRHIKSAIHDFCNWAFSIFKWCKMIIALIKKPSVARLVSKCGFSHIGNNDSAAIYVRVK